jgi:hypothetical protein
MERSIGLDVHAASCTLAVISEKGRKLKDFPVETNGQALVEALRMIPGRKHLVIEEGLQSAWLYETLSPHFDETDRENHAFFAWCGQHELRLQRWRSNGMLSYPPGTACPSDGTSDFEWEAVEGRGTVRSYSEVHHPLMPAFRDRVPI